MHLQPVQNMYSWGHTQYDQVVGGGVWYVVELKALPRDSVKHTLPPSKRDGIRGYPLLAALDG